MIVGDHSAGLPIRHNLGLVYVLSFIVVFLMSAASVAGLLYRAGVYPTDESLRTFLPNDVVNLFVGVPIVLGSMWLARRGGLIGLLLWPGALFFVLYNYIVYVFAMPLNASFVLHLALVASSAYTPIGLLAVPRASFVVAATGYGSRCERSNLQCPGRSLLGAGMTGGLVGGRWPNEAKGRRAEMLISAELRGTLINPAQEEHQH